MKSLCRKNSKNEVKLVINNNHFHLYNTFEKIPRQLLTFKIIHSILNVKWKWSHSVVPNSLRPHGTVAHQASPSMWFSRQEYWSGLPFPSPFKCKASFKYDVEVTNLNTLRSANERVMVFIITLCHPQKNALLFFFLKVFI